MSQPAWLIGLSGADLVMKDSDEAGAGPSSAKRRIVGEARKVTKGGDEEALTDNLLNLILKPIVKHEAMLRKLTGAMWHTFIFAESAPVIQNIRRVTMAYHTKVQEEGPKHGRGPPFVHAFSEMVRTFIDGPQPQEKVALEISWKEQVMQLSMDDLAYHIRDCRVSKCYKKKGEEQFWKIEYHVRQEALDREVYQGLTRLGGQRKAGIPPRGELEREAHKLLVEVGK